MPKDYLVGMRKLSDYFKPVPNPHSPKPRPQQRIDHGDIPGSSSPLSECLSIPTPSPPPRRLGTALSTNRSTIQNNTSGPLGKYTIGNKEPSHGDAASKNVIPDSEGEGSDSSLEDIDTIFLKHKGIKPIKRDQKQQKGKRPALAQSTINTKVDVDLPKYTFSLDALISEKVKDAEREETLKRTEALLARAEDEGGGEGADVAFGPQKELIDAAVGSDVGDKVLNMLNRREAWRQDYTWFFLDRPEECRQPMVRSPFPVSSLKEWSIQLKGTVAPLGLWRVGLMGNNL